MRVAVTGAGGRLGRRARRRPSPMHPSPARPDRSPGTRGAFDLDAPDGVGARLDRDRPEVVVHAAAWTDVDGCALDPELAHPAQRRRDRGPGRGLRRARRSDLLVVSTNEVFDGTRTDGQGYGPDDPTGARQSVRRLEARRASDSRRRRSSRHARCGARDRPDGLAVRGAGRDFPSRILERGRARARRRRAAPGRRRRVGDADLHGRRRRRDRRTARRTTRSAGIHHLVNGLFATRADWARYVVGPGRASTSRSWTCRRRPGSARRRPPRWGVLAPTPLPSGEPMRIWPDAMADYAPAPPARDAGQRMTRHDRGRRRRCRASATARSSATPTSAAPSASCGEPGDFPDEPFVQANLSTSAAGVLRGLHLHRRQDDLWIVGRRTGVRRPRRRPARCSTAPATAPLVETRELDADDWVVIPTGVAHGFLALDPLQLIYLVTNEYDGSDELGFAWDDPARRGRLAAARRDRPTDARSCRTVTRANPPLGRPRWCACATPGA